MVHCFLQNPSDNSIFSFTPVTSLRGVVHCSVSMEKMKYNLYPVHLFKQYITDCAHVINEEWSRSETARFVDVQTYFCKPYGIVVYKYITIHCSSSILSHLSIHFRVHMLEKSNDNLPISFALMDSKNNSVVGHSRISPVFGDSGACFVESGEHSSEG